MKHRILLGATLLAAACGTTPADSPEVPEHCVGLDPQSAQDTVRVDSALCRLGVDVTAPLPPIKDGKGNPLPTPHEDSGSDQVPWHPLGKDNTTYRPELEWFALAPANAQTERAAGIYEANHKNNEWALWANLRDTALKELGNLDDFDATTEWMHDSVKTGTGGDFDGDGYQEAAVAYLDRSTGALSLIVTEDQSGGYATTTYPLGTFPSFATSGASPGHLDITAGDIDGDGLDELVIAVGVRSYTSIPMYPKGDPDAWNESTPGTAKIIVLDDKRAGFAKLTEKSFGNGDARAIYVATGNGVPDARHTDEIAVSASINGQAKAYVYQYDPAKGGDKLTLLMDDSMNLSVSGHDAYLADVTFGDLNRDGLGEFIFAGIERPGPGKPDTRYVAQSLQARDGKFVPAQSRAWTDFASGDWKPANGTGTCTDNRTCDFVKVLDVFAETLDLQGDAHQEVLINNAVYGDNFADVAAMPGLMNNDNSQPRVDDSNTGDIVNAPYTVFHRSNTWITVGDFDGNGKDEIAFWGRNRGAGLGSPGATAIQIFGWDTSGSFRSLGYRSLAGSHADNPYGNYPVLFSLNADNDSARVSFVSSETNYTEPYPLVAIAAAPCFADPSAKQNLEECHSSFTAVTGSSSSLAEGGTFHVSIGAGAKFKFIGTEDELMAHFKYDYEGLTGTDRQHGESNTWEAGANQDAVLFTSIPIDLFHYQVTAVGNVPLVIDGKTLVVGDDITISVPRRASNMLANLDYYNDVVKNIAPDRVIGTDIFHHVAGDPTSYPTANEVNAIEAQRAPTQSPFYRSSPDKVVTVPQGGLNVVDLTLSEDVTVTQTYSHEVGGEITFAGDKAGVAYELAVGGGYKRDIEIANSTGFELDGSIGGIGDKAFYEKNRYGVGVMSYFMKVGGRDMRVVSFWREER